MKQEDGNRTIEEPSETRRDLADIIAQLATVYTKEGVGVWLLSPNKMLSGAIPLDVWKSGDHFSVRALVDQLGGMVAT